jgi:hypothetical protein
MTETHPAEAPRVEVLPDPERSPVTLDGPLDSEQSAVVHMAPEQLDELWQPGSLEALAQAYWRHLHRLSLRTLAVDYGGPSPAVKAFGRIELLRFHEPRFETGPDYGRVTWPIDRGILVARRGRGQGELAIDVRRSGNPGEATVTSRVSNFYPWLRGSGVFARLGRFIYAQTQLRIHVFVTKRFLRSLERLDLSARV